MSENFEKDRFDELLEKFKELKFEEKKNPTFLEIAKLSSKETAWSNILAFFLDPKREHNLKDLMLKSFFEALNVTVEIKNFNSIEVKPEFPTDNRKRIDLIIEAENFVIGIENKVNHFSNNPFEVYASKIDDIANGRKKLKVILSKNYTHEKCGFINLTYDSFIKYIKRNLPDYEASADHIYLIFFKDFLKNIENEINIKEMIENKEAFKYFKLNYYEIDFLLLKFMEFKEDIEQKFRNVRDAFDSISVEESIKQCLGGDPIVSIGEIDKSTGSSTFRIFVEFSEQKIPFPIYIIDGYAIYSYAANDDLNEQKIETIEDNELLIEINKDIKEIRQEISEFIVRKMENLFN